MKTYIIFIILAAAAVFAAYWAGGRISREECRADVAVTADAARVQQSEQIIKTQRTINAETLNTDSRAIRDWLRANYTIAE
ncbi:MAG: hypothetical protein FWC61_03740 [Proteobacteria bacterium]|nr:hypothetical protein [Pseudomonadota bacterium]